MDPILRISDALYMGLCHEVGTPTEVTIRRDAWDMDEMVNKPVQIYRGLRTMISGSYREGFRFQSSDQDWMFWSCAHKLITDIAQARLYDRTKHAIILMQDNDTPPGFVKLQLLTSPRGEYIVSSAVPVNDRIYVSSLLWQQHTLQNLNNVKGYRNGISHGPCANAYYLSTEFDIADCLAGIHWPALTRPWVERCIRHTWPPEPVLAEILENGYHCVPVGSKIVSSGNLLEWRLSFSQAEKQLVSSMNHTQFLVYGLLKIFLKEIVNYGVEEPLLCSYFLKTTVFWMTQGASVEWRPNNLLNCFWKCFKYLIHCVYRGVFPNFFIPQNNMFINKIVGNARTSLFEQLYQYYQMGVSCLLLSPTLRSILEPALGSLTLVIPSAEGHNKAAVDLDNTVRREIFKLETTTEELSHCFILLSTVDKLSILSLSPYQTLTLQYDTAEILIDTAFMMVHSTSNQTFKELYKLDRIVCNMLKLASRIGPVSYSLYLALYYYRTGRYNEALRVTCLTKQRLSQPYIMYHGTVDRQRYSEAVGSLSLSRKMKTAWVDNVKLRSEVHYIQELILEQEVSKQNDERTLFISPFVLTDMLLVLSHYRLGDISQCLQSLTDLHTLLLRDDGRYVRLCLRGLSWQILGICQHVVGDLHGALHSYQESLGLEQFNNIQTATENRIVFVERQLHRNRQS
ncbi:uncharacterized protein LOC125657948 [Ostrea edulis]|uniref:uncharacterized protein LOC125657948 n=1 Tax=Ostrea edulis TaxID=37623 RepID=UPI0024AF348D|nr:uncharacterized protein LOC125657948 [Ostrea edulis]XP_048744868.2 uncharacterized protein LOC125657948 [Ostrea edulis]XP_048744871.2 uncharacterized protein LOC125657948 [Ostrea edulis]